MSLVTDRIRTIPVIATGSNEAGPDLAGGKFITAYGLMKKSFSLNGPARKISRLKIQVKWASCLLKHMYFTSIYRICINRCKGIISFLLCFSNRLDRGAITFFCTIL